MTRTDKFRNSFDGLGIDGAIVLDELNIRYLCGFAFTDGLLLITRNRAFIITDFRYYEMAGKDAFSEYEVIMPENRKEVITKLLSEDNVARLGFEGGSVAYDVYASYKESYPTVTLVNIRDEIETLRQVKDESEITIMQKAQDITDAAFSMLLKTITPNMTELEVAAELEYNMRKLGASGLAFDTIAVSGDASSLPHGVPRNEKLKAGFLTIDFGASYQGYCSDMTRTVVIGRATDEIIRLYNTVLQAQLAAIDFIKAGVDCAEADKVARDIIDSVEEYKGAFGHSLGHGVGLFIHESPRLSAKGKGRSLRVGEIVTVEPGIYIFGKYGCRIEDMVAVRENGVLNFTHSTKELIEIL